MFRVSKRWLAALVVVAVLAVAGGAFAMMLFRQTQTVAISVTEPEVVLVEYHTDDDGIELRSDFDPGDLGDSDPNGFAPAGRTNADIQTCTVVDNGDGTLGITISRGYQDSYCTVVVALRNDGDVDMYLHGLETNLDPALFEVVNVPGLFADPGFVFAAGSSSADYVPIGIHVLGDAPAGNYSGYIDIVLSAEPPA